METTVTITKQAAERLHYILHTPKQYPKGCKVTVGGFSCTIFHAGNQCRYIDYAGVRWMEQNPNKDSHYAGMARNGWKITWGIRSNGSWHYVCTDPSGILREVRIIH